MRNLLILLLVNFTLSSCTNSPNEINSSATKTEALLLEPPPVVKPNENAAIGNQDQSFSTHTDKRPHDDSKKIIKTGELSFETNNVASTRKTIISTVRKLEGYAEGENESGYENGQKNYTLNLRVPATNFDALFQSISSAADRIDSKNIRIQDVTTEYIDLKTRLQNKKLLERRYLQLLNKALRISDMLSIENKLSEIRSEIESAEGQFLYMQKQVAYSTLTVTFYSKSIVNETGKGFGFKLKKALSNGWVLLQNLFFGSIIIWPVLIIIPLFYAWYRHAKRKVKQ